MAKSVAEMIKEAETEAPEWPKTFQESWIKAQAEMHHAVQDGLNPLYKSKYSTLHAVIDAVKPSLLKYGIGINQKWRAAEQKEGIEVMTTFIHHSGEQMMTDWGYVPVDRQSAHGVASAVTYGRRISLMAPCSRPVWSNPPASAGVFRNGGGRGKCPARWKM